MLDERKFMILRAIIDDYILTAMPVGSRTISRKQGVGFSPATIRNEMSDLEELGYLAQPHTSAGRVPSDKAYRLYVDSLLKGGELSEQEKLRISDYISRRAGQVEDVIRAAADILADETQYTSVIVAPRIQQSVLLLNRSICRIFPAGRSPLPSGGAASRGSWDRRQTRWGRCPPR